MMTVLACIAGEHNPWLTALAAVVCLTGSYATVHLFRRSATTRSVEKGAWIVVAAFVTGASIWCTHFIAMLGYEARTTVEVDPVLSIVSLLAAMLGAGLGMALAAARLPLAPALGGAVVGLSIVVMHYTGMMGYWVQGLVSWDRAYLFASIAIAALFSAAAFHVVRRVEGPWRDPAAIGLLVLAIVGLHFTGMTAFRVEPLAVEGSFSNPAALWTLALAVATVSFVVIGAGFASGMIDDRARADASQALANMSNGLVMVSAAGRVTLFNERAREIFGLGPAELREGMTLSEFIDHLGHRAGWTGERIRRVRREHRHWMTGTQTRRLEQELEDGRVIGLVCRPLKGAGAVLTYEDVTEARQGQKKIVHMAYHDSLTGLANRRLFAEALGTEAEGGCTLLMFDLDRFKAVNDRFGHALGDELLVEVGARLKALAGAADMVFRLGGDEFAILVFEDRARAPRLAAAVVETLGIPFAIGAFRARIGCSVGIASVEGAGDVDSLQRRADLALYEAKKSGRGRVEIYRDGMMEEAIAHQWLEDELSLAMERGQLELHYQPLYTLPDRTLTGFEALLRWHHPEHGPIPPATFIPVAEASGSIDRIGAWVLDEACRQAARWPSHLYVSINVSAVQLRSPAILAQIERAISTYDLDPRKIEIEITETAMVDNSEQIGLTLAGCRALGIRVAMDDFGTGYSSLAHLREFKVDRIKIDRSFTAAVGEDAGAAAVVRAVMGIARELSIETTAEGIESEHQLERLITLGCGTAQGYLLGRPMNLAAASVLFEDEDGSGDEGRSETLRTA